MDDLEQRYATVLALVPDEDVAGDLFMAARNEQDLWRRAVKWREQNGFGPPPANLRPLPLTDAQKEHARHLARRAKRRRTTIGGLGAAVATVVLLAAGMAALRTPANAALAKDPVYEGKSIAVTDESAGLQLAIYQVEADPGTVTVWWSLSGQGAAARAEKLQPQISFGTWTDSDWYSADKAALYSSRPDRVLGRSEYTRFARDRANLVHLRMLDNAADKEVWNLAVPLRRVADEAGARVYAVAEAGTLPVTSLSVSSRYTAVRRPRERGSSWLFLETDRTLLAPRGTWPVTDTGLRDQTTVFPPLPTGTRKVTVLRPNGNQQGILVPVGQVRSSGGIWVTDWKQTANSAEATVTMAPSFLLTSAALGEDGNLGGRGVLMSHEYLGKDPDGNRQWRVSVKDMPELSQRPFRMLLSYLRMQEPVPATTITLSP